MDQENQPIENPTPPEGYPQGRFILLLCALGLILVLVSIAQFEGVRAVEPSGISESVLQGDLAAKIAYVYTAYIPSLRSETAESIDLALQRYEEAAREAPSPEVYRRLIVLSYQSGRKDAVLYINTLEHLKAGKSKRAELTREASMWRTIYLGGKLTPEEARVYAQRMTRLDLGWYEYVALNHLYKRAGMLSEARVAHGHAQNAALKTLILLGLLVFGMLLLGLVGVGLLIWYAGKKPKGIGSADMPSASDDPIIRSKVAGYLLESFVSYMLTIIVVQLVAAAFLEALDIRLGATGEVMATVGIYVLSGLLALVFLAARLRIAGMTWEHVGLRSRQPFADVLAGIGAYAAALPLVVLSAYIVNWLSRYMPSQENVIVPLFVESESFAARMMLFLLAVVAAPFFEEIFFRGVLFSSLRAKWGIASGVIVSAVVFGLVHPLPMGLLPILVLGIVFAVVFSERGSLLPSMVAHALTNSVAFALLFILAG